MKKSLFAAIAILSVSLASAAPSTPPPPPSSGSGGGGGDSGSSREAPELSFFNDGVKLLFKKEWSAAQIQFEAAVAINPDMAEAHNNLAYVMRKQGAQNHEKALEHYNRAIELKPKLAEAYMYRGALHRMMGNNELALADHAQLAKLKSKLAPHLKKIIDTGTEEDPEHFYGVVKKKK